jgi:hypothetical protein
MISARAYYWSPQEVSLNILQPSQWTSSTDLYNNQMLVGGSTYWVQNAQKSWSITNPTGDSSSLRFEVRQGDVWAQGDGTISPLKNRSEIAGTTQYSVGTDIHIKYGFTVEPGATNTASWLTAGQLRQTANDPVSAPFGIMFTGEHMRIYAAEGGSSGQNYVTLYQDPNNIVRGHEYQMQIDARFDPVNGHLDVVRDGVTIVNYNGPLGWNNMGGVYWKEGVYRADAPESIAMDYNHLSITTGAATSPPPPPASPPPPPPAPTAPTGLADAAVVGGYVNAAHNTTSQALTGSAVAGAKVSVYDGANLLGTTTAGTTGQWSYTLGQLTNGGHTLTATATTSAGVSAKSAALAFTVDTIAPGAPGALADSAIVNGVVDAAHNTTTQALTGTAEAGATVTVYDGATKLGVATAGSTGQWSYTVGQLTDGSHSLTAAASDQAGNVGAASGALQFTVNTQTTTPPPPTSTTSPHVDDVTTTSVKPQLAISGEAAAGSTVKVYDNGALVGTATANNSGDWSFNAKVGNGNGIHSFTETSVDPTGASSSSTGAAIFSRAGGIQLTGGSGDDVLFGRAGDALVGGAGHDKFVFDVGFGRESVQDFDPASDTISFDHTLFSSSTDVLAHATQSGTSVLISHGSDILTLQNTSLSALHASDFLLA